MKDNSVRAQVAIAIFVAISISSLVGIWSDFLQVQLLERFLNDIIPSDEAIATNDLRVGIVSIAHLALIIGTIFAFLYWFRRAYTNLSLLKDIQPKYEDNMAVWSFFIPILNLFRPVQIALDIHRLSRKKLQELESGYSSAGTGLVIGLWWASYLLSNVIANASFRMMMNEDESVSALLESSQFSMISGALDFVSALATIGFIYMLSRQEQALAGALAENTFDELHADVE